MPARRRSGTPPNSGYARPATPPRRRPPARPPPATPAWPSPCRRDPSSGALGSRRAIFTGLITVQAPQTAGYGWQYHKGSRCPAGPGRALLKPWSRQRQQLTGSVRRPAQPARKVRLCRPHRERTDRPLPVDARRPRPAAGPCARGDDPHELLPAVHRVASLAKRWLLSTHQGSVDEAHLQSYLEEFVFRFNRRRSTARARLLSGARAGRRPRPRCATATSSPAKGHEAYRPPGRRHTDIRQAWSVRQRIAHGGPPTWTGGTTPVKRRLLLSGPESGG